MSKVENNDNWGIAVSYSWYVLAFAASGYPFKLDPVDESRVSCLF
jgi:hypothetical protein